MYERQKYNEIDNLFVEYIKKLLNLRLPNEEVREMVIDRKIEGGLELMLPGVYYNSMKKMQDLINDGKEDEFSFFVLKT